jgi:serine/threonine-protein kinase
VVSHPETRQLYALKRVLKQDEKDVRFFDQVANEFEVSKSLAHPNLRRSFDLKDNSSFLRKATEMALVMELFDGSPLDALSRLSIEQTVSVFHQVAQGLRALHGHGFVHCDLKPNNILVGAGGQVKVIDFGQACKAGTVKERIQGTPDFIAPEQVKRHPVTLRTDVFNFGATLYHALTGQNIPTLYTLKRTENSFLVDDRIQSPRDLKPDVPEPLSNLTMECVRLNPAKRPADMNELVRRLEIIQHVVRRQSQVA